MLAMCTTARQGKQSITVKTKPRSNANACSVTTVTYADGARSGHRKANATCLAAIGPSYPNGSMTFYLVTITLPTHMPVRKLTRERTVSMTDMHTKCSIERYVKDEVTRWNKSNSIDIYLSSGYGPPLIWRCCEFEPKNQELLGQLQYLQDTSTGVQNRRVKYSPPFALEKLDESDDEHFQKYLDNELMHPNLLKSGLAWTFYEEECMVDPDCFQAQVLQRLCNLFTETRDQQVRALPIRHCEAKLTLSSFATRCMT